MDLPRAIVIGAGSTGAAVACDLALRGFQVTVVERGGVASGTTGHNQAQLHSGARYAVVDPESARECIQENEILRRILPGGLELNDGLFVGITERHREYLPVFLEACANCGIPARSIPPLQALRWEPLLNPAVCAAVLIPDGVIDPYRLCLSFLATAAQHRARVYTFSRVVGIDGRRGQVTIWRRTARQEETLEADVVINAAGPWASQVAALAGVKVELEASAGVMAAIDRRVCSRVLNLLDLPADGDIIVPQRGTSILGTTSWTVADPDQIDIPAGHDETIFDVAAQLVPAVRQAKVRGVMAAARPLLKVEGAGGRASTRGFACYRHAGQGSPALFSVLGGKTTTARLMAEKLGDLVCLSLGVQAECRTREQVLVSHRRLSEFRLLESV